MGLLKALLFVAFLQVISASHVSENYVEKVYKPDWDDLDTRPLPEWYDKAKIGIMIHWGVYSVLGIENEWLWFNWNKTANFNFINKNYVSGQTYQDFASLFTAELFDPEQWAKLFAKAGAKYVVLTTKHHDGFALFPSKRSFSWNAMDIGPKQDLVKAVSKFVKKAGMKFGVYYSLYEWFHPLYKADKATNFNTSSFADLKAIPDIKQIFNDYKPSLLWSDGDWETTDKYWKSTEVLSWLYNDSPSKDEVVVNDRWGKGTGCAHGDFYNCDDRYNPKHMHLHKWEDAFSLDKKSWGYRRDTKPSEIMTIDELLSIVVAAVSCGRNALINVPPTRDGTIPLIFQERLLQLGKWLKCNGEAIYQTSPWLHQKDKTNPDVWYTCNREYNPSNPINRPSKDDVVTAVYAIFLKWPANNVLVMSDLASYLVDEKYQITLLGTEDVLKWQITKEAVEIALPPDATDKLARALKITPAPVRNET